MPGLGVALVRLDTEGNEVSAWVVSQEHVRVMVEGAKVYSGPFDFRWRKPGDEGRWGKLDKHDGESLDALGQMLWDENVRSVTYRYGSEDLPGVGVGSPGVTRENGETVYRYRHAIPVRTLDPLGVVQAVYCYEYQSCEHPEWEESEAHAVCQSLARAATQAAIDRLLGEARMSWWGVLDPSPEESKRRPVSLMDIAKGRA